MKLRLLVLFSFLFLGNHLLYSQCAYNNTITGANITPPCPGSTTTTINGGQFVRINVTTGNQYTFSTCGAGCDTQLSLYTSGGGSSIAYNDDGCGTASTITWTATFTGQVDLLLDQYSCANGCNGTTITIACAPAPAPPANDNPCGAINLPVGAGCTPTTVNITTGATGTTGVPAPTCGSYAGSDLWYSVTVPASGSVTVTTASGTLTDCVMSIYSTPACGGAFTQVGCADDVIGAMPSITLTGQTPGAVLYVRVWEYGSNAQGNFTICSTTPTPCNSGGANNSCATADPFCTGTTYNYCNSTGVPDAGTYGCLLTTPNPAYYYLNVATSGPIDILMSQTATGSGAGIDVDFICWGPFGSTGAACTAISGNPSANVVDCSYSTAATETVNIPAAVAGQWYMLLITNFSNQAGSVAFSQSGGSGSTNCAIVSPCSVSTTQTNVLCNGAATGSAIATPTGSAPFTYSWSPAPGGGQGTATATGLSAGNYTVTVTQSGGGICTATVTITQPTALAGSTTQVNVLCNGATTGSTTITASGGTAPYNISWTGTTSGNPAGNEIAASGGTYTINGLGAGTYNITITDANGCTRALTAVTITQPTVLAIGTTPTHVSCVGGTNGAIAVTGTNGTAPYNVSWAGTATGNPAGNEIAASGGNYNITGLAAGAYTVTLTDANGCIQTANVTINPGVTVNANITPVASQCLTGNSFNFSGSTSTISSGSITSYTWNWGDATANGSGVNATHTYGAAGTYTVTLTASNGTCTNAETFNVTVFANPTVTVTPTNPLCNGGTGSITANGAGGVGPYNYSWAAPLSTTGATVNNVPVGGPYTVTVTTSQGCTVTGTASITQPTAVTATISGTNVSCNGGANGTATVVPSGGAGGYTYVWSPAPGGGQGTATATGLTAQAYTVTITDANGCSITRTFTPTQPTALTATISGTNVSCNGGANGTATVVPSGGPGGNTFVWAPAPGGGQGTATATGLTAQTYTVTITSTGGCTITRTFTPTQPTAVTATISGTNVSCNGGANGTATVVPSGGAGGYTYVWAPAPGGGQGTATATGLTAQAYTVTITDASGCSITRTFTPTQPTALTATISGTNVSCNGGANGTATVVPSGGPGGNTFVWAPAPGGGQGTATATGLTAQAYTVTVTSTGGCTTTATFTPTQPTALTATISGTNVSCNGGANGTATVVPSGGPGGNTFVWAPAPGGGQGTATATGLTAQAYTVTITSTGGCTATATYTPTQPTALTATISGTNVSCNGGANGTATVVPSGGPGGNTFVWAPAPGGGQGTATATGLTAQAYTVTVTSTGGCTTTATFTPTQPTALTATISGTGVTCNGGNNGTATVVPSGGPGGNTFVWAPAPGGGQGTAAATGLTSQAYTVTITSTGGCTTTATFTPTQPAVLTASVAGTNVSCNGGANATATVTPVGGPGGNTFSWAPAPGGGQGTASVTGLSAQTYTVTVTSTGGCTTTATYTPTQPTAISLTPSSTNTNCGASTGTATVVAAGGAGGYTYSWNSAPVQTTSTATALAAGGYIVTVTDANGCTQTANVNVGNNAAPSLSEVIGSHVNVSCNGGANGSAAVLASGGAGGYTYSWAPAPGGGQGTATATGLTAQTYTVTVTDAGGCSALVNITITQPTAITTTISGTNVTCNGGADGTATVVPSGGPGGNTFVWAPAPGGGQGTATATGLTAQAYTVTITSTGGCTATATYTPTQPTALTATISGTNVSCNGGANGTATVVPSGGPGGNTFVWAPAPGGGQGTATATGLTAQAYTVTVTSTGGCTTTATFTPTQPTVLSATISGTNVSCNGGANGTATVVPSGGPGGNTFVWAPAPGGGQGTATATGLTAQAYTVTVTSTGGCTTTATFTPTQPTVLSATISGTNVSCNGGANGTATVVPSGGPGGNTFVWAPAPGGGQGTATATGLTAQAYTVTVTSTGGCTTTATFTPTQPTVLTGSVTAQTNVSCNGLSDGTVTVAGSGGTPTYQFNIGAGNQPSGVFSGLNAGSHPVTITDGNGCTVVVPVTITQPTVVSITSATGTNPLCNGACDGTLTATATGGTGAITYTWTGLGAGQNQSGVCAGTYTITVADANGCTATSTATITNPPALAISTIPVDAHCGLSDGSASANTTGGTGAITYIWYSNAGLTTQIGTGANLGSLSAGTYYVQGTDANGCTVSGSVTIGNLAGVTASTVVNSNATGAGLCNGSATVTPSGGTPGYTFLWGNGVTTATASNLCVGSNCVTVTDATGCSVNVCVVITEPAPLAVALTPTNLLCNGVCNGSVVTNVTGGVAPYTYLWSNGATTANVAGVCAGFYSVTVTDANGNTSTISTSVTQPTAVSVTSVTPGPALCNGVCNGTLTAVATGGTGVLTYTWAGLGTGQNQTGVCAGTYNLTVTDANGCPATSSGIVTEPAVLTVNIVTANANCGASNGSATATPAGGTTTYSYLWSAGSVTATQSGIPAGAVSVTVTDANGCTVVGNAVVANNPTGTLTMATDNNVSCFGAANGQATGTVTGGAGPFTYSWSPSGGTAATATNLGPGTFTLTVTDVNLCTLTGTATITEPSVLVVNPSKVDVNCYNGTDGSVNATVLGGTTPYSLAWTNSGGTNVGSTLAVTNLPADTYTITATDANGCVQTGTVIVAQPALYSLVVTPVNVDCKDACTGSATATVSGGTAPYNYIWNDPLTQITATASFLCDGNYAVNVTDAHGCPLIGNTAISEPPLMVLTPSSVDAHCQQNDGSGCIATVGGVAPYTFDWLSTTNTTNCDAALFSGTYLVEVTDANGCRDTAAIQVNDIAGPSAVIIAQTNVSCFGNNDGSATVNMIGGTGIFTVQWDALAANQTTPTASNLSSGTYSVNITDAAGCAASTNVTITEPMDIIYIPNTVDPSCFSYCDGLVWIGVNGGTLPYTFDWRDNANNPLGVNNDSLPNLCQGTYTLILTDAQGCQEIVNYTLADPTQVTGTIAGIANTCNASCNGVATVTMNTGVAPFTYQWNDPFNQTSASASGLCVGTYTVIATDDNGCFNTYNVNITEPTLLTATINSFGDVSCAGTCDGFAQVLAAGGTPPYAYNWNNGVATQLNSNLCIGTYIITVTDANGCTAADTITIVEPNGLVVNVTSNNVTCFNACNGDANAAISGGTTPYSIQWDNPTFATTAAVSNLCDGVFNVLVTDANGCFVNTSITITEPAILDFSLVAIDANCGQNNGQICASLIGGVPPYAFQWDDPAAQTTSCAFNLLAGCYTATLTDGNGCVKDSLICINDIAGPTITLNSFTDVTCFGVADGSISVNAIGGSGALTIEWYDGTNTLIPGLNNQSSTNTLSGDTYAVTVTDTANCLAALTQFIFEPNGMVAAITASTQPNCFNGCDGTATVSSSGGVGGNVIVWSSGATPNAALNTGLCAGTYNVTVTDANGCPASATTNIAQPTQLVITTVSTVDVSCFSICDGIVNTNATGGTMPYLFAWTGNVSTGPSATNLCAGPYTTTVTDANGCVASINNTITEPTALTLALADVDATCSQCNGASTATVGGGTIPYNYAWVSGNSLNTPVNGGLCAGNTNLTVTDAHGCTITGTAVIIDQAGPVISGMTMTQPLCNGQTNGTATVNTTGGTNPLVYAWDDPSAQTTQTATALVTGTYCVTVTDNNSCNATNCINVTEPNPLLAVGDLDVTICYGDSTQIWGSGMGGTAPYTTNWSTAGITGPGPIMVYPLVTTTYCFDVTDVNGCVSPNECVTITVNPPLAVDVTPSTSICDGASINLIAQGSGGNGGPYTFTWVDEFGNVIPNTTTGNNSSVTVSPTVPTWYFVTLDDGCSLTITDSTQISINALPVVFVNAVSSAGCAPFTAQFILNTDIGVNFSYDFECDGIPDYTGTNPNTVFTYLNPGTYDVCVDVTSAAGCVTTVTNPAMITVYPVPVADFTPDPTLTTILSPTVTFGDLSTGNPVNYNWDFGDGNTLSGAPGVNVPNGTNNGQTTGTFDNPLHMYADTGTFTITLLITNQFGCTDQISYTVTVEGDYILFAPSGFTPNGDGINDGFIPQGIGFDPDNFEMLIFNRWGELIYQTENPNKPWDGMYKSQMSKQDVYVWKVRTMDHKGNFHDYIGHVTLLK